MRRLLVCTRSIPATGRAAYETLWREVAGAVRAADGRAWRFVSAADAARFVEFIEWKQDGAGAALPDRPDVAAPHARLEAAFPSASRELLDETPTP